MANEVCKEPPFSNRGVLRTRDTQEFLENIAKNDDFYRNQKIDVKLEENYILIDWIQATIINDYIDAYSLFKNLFGINSLQVVKEAKGFFGYDTTYSYKDIKIMTAEYRKIEGLGDMGFHILISGTGCRCIEDLNINYQDLFKKLLDYHAKFTRLDVSFDDYSRKYFTISLIKKAIKNGEVVTRFRNSIEFLKTKLEDGSNQGSTIWFGSRASDIQIVFYDKLKERESQDFIVNKEISFWIRLECRFRNHNANEVATNLANKSFREFKIFYVGIISNYIRFVKKNEKDKNKRRWQTIDWWQKFIDNVENVSLQSINVESTISKKRNWMLNTTSRNNLMVLMSEMEFLTIDNILGNYMFEMLKKGTRRVTDLDLQYINDLRIKNGLVTIQKEELNDFLKDVKEYLVEMASMV